MSSNLFQILQIVSSLFIPITMVWISLKITKTIERRKLDALKEKEWQVKWADMFLELAIEFNKHVAFILSSRHYLKYDKDKEDTNKKIFNSFKRMTGINWDLQNYSQFAKGSESQLTAIQDKLLNKIKEHYENGGDVEGTRKLQIKYNNLVKQVHAEILELREEYKIKYYNK